MSKTHHARAWIESVEDPSDAETQIAEVGPRGESASREFPVLTILGHPRRSRIGERSPLPNLTVGGEVAVSRLSPRFLAPRGAETPGTVSEAESEARTARASEGERQPSFGKPLGGAYISRQPIRLRGLKGGGVELDVRSTRTPVVAEGERVDDHWYFSSDEVSRGVVLEIGHRVVLLLHQMPEPLEAPVESLGLVGESGPISRVRREILRVAGLGVPVLVRGETGTGKELVARALHLASGRRTGPFVAVSLAALPPTLAAAELFGAARGAFTGADRKRSGFFQKAHGGTLFLDEIGEAPAEIQAMLLRVLETGSVIPVGSHEPVPVDVRVVSATDADLEAEMGERRFRAPLFHRLAGYAIELPPLRARRDDIGRLLVHFLEIEAREIEARELEGAPHPGAGGLPWPSTALVARLARADWPGNVRQLRNVARWLLVRGAGEDPPESELVKLLAGAQELATDGRDHDADSAPLPKPPRSSPLKAGAGGRSRRLYRAPKDVTDKELLEALRLHGWRLKPTAEYLRVSRTSLYALIDRCPAIRRASDLDRTELAACFERHGGDLAAMATDLEISPQGLRHRLQKLGFS